MKIEQTLKQRGIMSPQMIQSMELLRMNTAELEEYLQQLAMENPVMELEPPKRETAEGKTRTEISPLRGEARKGEIVRLLGGEGSGAAATLADELLESCAKYKEERAQKGRA